jgi:hypothetical protein
MDGFRVRLERAGTGACAQNALAVGVAFDVPNIGPPVNGAGCT